MTTPTPVPHRFIPPRHRPAAAPVPPSPEPAPPPQPVPAFLSVAKPPGDVAVSQLEAAARSGLDAIGQLIHERDKLADAFNTTRAQLLQANARVEVLDAQLFEVNARLQHYTHLSSALMTRLNDIQQVIQAAMDDARTDAHSSRGAPGLTVDEEARLRDLAQRMRPDDNPEKPTT